MRWILASLAILGLCAAAQAQQGAAPQPGPTPGPAPQTPKVQRKSMAELYPPLPGVEYYCTDAQGQRNELGTVSCFTASCQTWTARCEMAAQGNMAMWRKLQDGCPAVSAEPAAPDSPLPASPLPASPLPASPLDRLRQAAKQVL